MSVWEINEGTVRRVPRRQQKPDFHPFNAQLGAMVTGDKIVVTLAERGYTSFAAARAGIYCRANRMGIAVRLKRTKSDAGWPAYVVECIASGGRKR